MTLPAQDIVERLRQVIPYQGKSKVAFMCHEAAATISRLTADNEALREEVAEERAAHHRTSHKAVKRLRALWREKQAAEARADALAKPITMQDVRLAVGEGKLRPIDVLNGANAELRRRAALSNRRRPAMKGERTVRERNDK